MWWYVELNGTILPTPYKKLSDCMQACEDLKKQLTACITRPVLI